MASKDKTQEIRRLHETMYEKSLLFLVLRTSPDCEAKMVETQELIMRIYGRIQGLL